MRTVLFALLAAILALNVQAQNWPQKPVRFVVPFPPGGSVDPLARLTALKLGEALKQQFIVENRAGAAGAIGTHEVARAAPDGYTILFAADPVVTLHLVLKNVPYEVLRDFVAVTQVTTQPLAVAVHPSLPVNSVQELVAFARTNPGKLSFGHSGTGSGQHMSGELLKKLAGIDIVHVPYKRAGGPGPRRRSGADGGARLDAVDTASPRRPHQDPRFHEQGAFPHDARDPNTARVRLSGIRHRSMARPSRAARHQRRSSRAPSRRNEEGARLRGCKGEAAAGGAAAGRQLAERVRGANPRRP